jgi:Excalibur calcium-binding domain
VPSKRNRWVLGFAGLAIVGVAGVGLTSGASDKQAVLPVPSAAAVSSQFNNLSDVPAYAVLGDGKVKDVPAPDADDDGPHYRYCSEARKAGVAPLYRGDPGYAEHLDRDHDGIACEPYVGR